MDDAYMPADLQAGVVHRCPVWRISSGSDELNV
jgi:hypothetical protein